TRLLPDVVRLRRVEPNGRVHVVAGVGGLFGVGIAGGDQAVEIGGCGFALELLEVGEARGLREVVVFQLNVKDVAEGGARRHRSNFQRLDVEPDLAAPSRLDHPVVSPFAEPAVKHGAALLAGLTGLKPRALIPRAQWEAGRGKGCSRR